jgi:hypothetical protein
MFEKQYMLHILRLRTMYLFCFEEQVALQNQS